MSLPNRYLPASLPANETQRLKALREYAILDTVAEQAFDDLARMAALVCATPIAIVTLVDQDRQWFKAQVGFEASETSRDCSFCAHAILQPEELMLVPDARKDPRFAGHPFVVGGPEIGFYAGAPLVSPTGEALGTLCVADYKPRELSDTQRAMLRGLAQQAMAHLEMRRSLGVLEAAIESQSSYVGRLKQDKHHLQLESATDPLTGLGNRRAFEARLGDELARVARGNSTVALLLLDVDFFKRYNDSFGHPAGDALLRQLAQTLLRCCRSYDFAARIGGEEFAVVLPGTAPEGAWVIAERIRRALLSEVWPHRPVTASLGVAFATGDGTTITTLLERADRALYRSKQEGRNRVTLAAVEESA